MKRPFCLLALCLGSLAATLAEPAPVADPAELVAARETFDAAIAPLREKLTAAISERAKGYATQLELVESQLAGSGKADSLASVRAEREAYSAGRGTSGFADDDKKVPTSARDLRRAYDRDVGKLRAEHSPAARPAGTAFVRALDELERKFTAARNADGVLAVRRQKQAMQGATADPLAWGDASVLSKWRESENLVMTLRADGTVTTNRAPRGKWTWDDRGRGKITIKFEGWQHATSYELTPDGRGMNGRNPKGEKRTLARED